MVKLDLSTVSANCPWITDKWNASSKEQKVVVGVLGASTVVATSILLYRRYSDSCRNRPTVFDLSGGSIEKTKVKNEWDNYESSYGKEAGEGIKDRSKTTQLVDIFYSLVTDIYEYGWGQSFHFSPKLPGKNWQSSEAAHEARVAVELGLRPGMKVLDCGCGVGGPMRTIASVSGAHVTGITINQYQVDRANHHNQRLGVAPLAEVVRGNFCEMPFPPNTFDAVYAIEATCHANKLEEVYSEIFKVLKPGGLFLSYEWVSTKTFDPNNPEHVKVIDEINFGNGLPEMRTYKQAEEAGKAVGFKLVTSLDLATSSSVADGWWKRLDELAWQNEVSHVVVSTLDALWLAPKGLKHVHNMLRNVARSLVAGGKTGVFSPMHMLVFQKPQ